MTNDYYPRARRETKAQAVQRINEENRFHEAMAMAAAGGKPAEDREAETADYLKRHDERFGIGVQYDVGDPEGESDVG